MAETNSRGDMWSVILFTVLLVMGLATLALGVFLAITQFQYIVLGLGVVATVIAAAAAAVAQKIGADRQGPAGEDTQLLRIIANRAQMSQVERRVVDRQRDREALRQAIQGDIEKQDYEAALALVDDMAEQFGYVEEAEQYRQQIIDARARRRDELIRQSIANVDEIASRYDWEAARREVDRLMRLYPEDSRIAALPLRVAQARDDHKRDVERQFLRAAEIGDTEKAMELLKELDRYLTPQEAEAYLETARGVIGQARENTAVRFRMAVSDRDWIEAMNVGEQIIREFPNSQIANEVRDMMDVLRERAAGQRTAEAGRPV